MNRSEQISEAFNKFHAENPNIWRLFEQFTLELIRAGHAHGSSDAVFHRIRWHVNIDTKKEGSLKLNNNFTALYARLFHDRHPEYVTFFRNRVRKSEGEPAGYPDRQEFIDAPAWYMKQGDLV